MFKQAEGNKYLQKILKASHIFNLIIFFFIIAYLFIYALFRAQQRRWFIVSLPGYSALVILTLLIFYLFAVYRGLITSQDIIAEHPLTTSFPYMLFYNLSPLYGIFIALATNPVKYMFMDYLFWLSVSVAGVTFFVWIIIDSAAGFLEMLLPASRAHRRLRIAQAEERRKKQAEENCKFLSELHLRDKKNKLFWEKIMRSDVQELARLVSQSRFDDKTTESQVVEIGAKAFKKGGVECMKYLYSTAKEISRHNREIMSRFHYISVWWDGIGSWRGNELDFKEVQEVNE